MFLSAWGISLSTVKLSPSDANIINSFCRPGWQSQSCPKDRSKGRTGIWKYLPQVLLNTLAIEKNMGHKNTGIYKWNSGDISFYLMTVWMMPFLPLMTELVFQDHSFVILSHSSPGEIYLYYFRFCLSRFTSSFSDSGRFCRSGRKDIWNRKLKSR